MVAEAAVVDKAFMIDAGATWDRLFTWQGVNLTGWTSPVAKFETVSIIPTVTPGADSQIYVKLTPSQTNSLPNSGRFQLSITDPTGNVQRIVVGTFQKRAGL
jgi:hypothetical protein